MNDPRPYEGTMQPNRFLHGDITIVPARIASLLVRHSNLQELRTRARGVDPEFAAVLIALQSAAMSWRASATGSPEAPEREAEQRSKWVGTTQAATILGITSRGVRLAIQGGRLPAQEVNGRWQISREDIAHHKAGRTA
jgi:hypothetical protein